jgi:hypothetical protein
MGGYPGEEVEGLEDDVDGLFGAGGDELEEVLEVVDAVEAVLGARVGVHVLQEELVDLVGEAMLVTGGRRGTFSKT